MAVPREPDTLVSILSAKNDSRTSMHCACTVSTPTLCPSSGVFNRSRFSWWEAWGPAGASLGALRPAAVAPEAEVERRRRDDRGAEEVGCGERVSPSPWGRCLGSRENFSIFELKKARFGASLVLFFAVD